MSAQKSFSILVAIGLLTLAVGGCSTTTSSTTNGKGVVTKTTTYSAMPHPTPYSGIPLYGVDRTGG